MLKGLGSQEKLTPFDASFLNPLFLFLLLQGLLLDVFRVTFKNGFNIASLNDDHVLNNGTRLFVLSGIDFEDPHDSYHSLNLYYILTFCLITYRQFTIVLLLLCRWRHFCCWASHHHLYAQGTKHEWHSRRASAWELGRERWPQPRASI